MARRLGKDEILERLVSLNAERAAEEAAGFVRYVRPEYQAPEGVQMQMDTGDGDLSKEAVEKEKKKPWPSDLPARVRAVQQELSGTRKPLDLDTINGRFSGGRYRRKQVANLLKTLVVLGHARETDDGRYVP